MLFDSSKHETQIGTAFDEGLVRSYINSIRSDAEREDRGSQFWLEHPLENDRDVEPDGFLSSLYFGAAGSLWALRELGSSCWRSDRAEDLWNRHVSNPDFEERKPGLLLGDLGVALIAWELCREQKYLDIAYEAAMAAIPEPELELLWGAPGAIHVARHVFEKTGEERWKTLGVTGADHLLSHWKRLDSGARIWTQNLYGKVMQLLGAGHGFAGNAGALLSALPWLEPSTKVEVLNDIAETVIRLAKVEGEGANWQTSLEGDTARGLLLLQWCHGAPGFLTALARYPTNRVPELELLFLAAGHLIWRAGPLKKPHGLCHGTAGNAYAFLMLFHRTQDEIWLARAKNFAMHAIKQSDQAIRPSSCALWS